MDIPIAESWSLGLDIEQLFWLSVERLFGTGVRSPSRSFLSHPLCRMAFMVATIAPAVSEPVDASPARAARRPQLRLIEGGAGRPGPSKATFLRRRLVAFLLMVTCVVAVAVGTQAALRPLVASPGGGASAASGVTQANDGYVVQPGDTLWSIATAITPGGSDIRATVDRLVELNGGPELTVGRNLVLPD